MKYLHVDSISGLMGNGCTDPLNAKLINGTYAVVKTFNNPYGNLVLFNEYVCYQICESLKIPIPPSGICIIDKDTKCRAGFKFDYDACSGLGFYSTRIDKTTLLVPNVVRFISNRECFYKIILFDHVVYNKDRNKGNVILSATKKDVRMFAIDHTHVFKNQSIWDAVCLKQGIKGNDYNDDIILKQNSEIYDMFRLPGGLDRDKLTDAAEVFKEIINRPFIQKVINSVPDEWKTDPVDAAALEEYLLYRMEHINDMSELILNGGRKINVHG